MMLSGLTASFDVLCRITLETGVETEKRVSILECTAGLDVQALFPATAMTILRVLGPTPTMTEAAIAVSRLAAIFSALTRPSRQSVTGLIGELMVILLALDPITAVDCWRVTPEDHFDFAAGDARLEVKASSSGLRLHSFSWEQCNPPHRPALVASLLVDSSGGGTSLRHLLHRIEARLANSPETALRLRETVTATMGASLSTALDHRFDEAASRASLRWFDLHAIPAIRGDLPPGVGHTRFTSDLSLSDSVSPNLLAQSRLGALIPNA